ncbi:MAG: hypothetical protein IT448_06605 [Phycisphaerales bacterium]|nr:hypothetical protein [Phycisphaerales bacterium]
MRWWVFISAVSISLAVGLSGGAAWVSAQTGTVVDTRLVQIRAASADAMASLQQQIGTMVLADGVTIGSLVQKTSTQTQLAQLLEQARQIGGPRWLDAHTVQIRLELSGAAISAFVESTIQANPTTAPVTLVQVQPALQALVKRQLSTSGTSASASTIEDIRPAATDGVWSKIDPQYRRQAIALAHQHAVQQVIDSVRVVALPDGTTLGSLIDNPQLSVGADLHRYLMSRPVTAVNFRDDQQVEVTISAPAEQVFQALRRIVETTTPPTVLTDSAWAQMLTEFQQSPQSSCGLGQLPQSVALLPRLAPVTLPVEPPLWAGEMIDAVGAAEAADTRLKTRRAAEQDALVKLRQQVMELPLTPELKLGDAALNDPQIAAAVDRALSRARAYKSDYFSDGRVVVRSSLELRDVWDQLQEQ